MTETRFRRDRRRAAVPTHAYGTSPGSRGTSTPRVNQITGGSRRRQPPDTHELNFTSVNYPPADESADTSVIHDAIGRSHVPNTDSSGVGRPSGSRLYLLDLFHAPAAPKSASTFSSSCANSDTRNSCNIHQSAVSLRVAPTLPGVRRTQLAILAADNGLNRPRPPSRSRSSTPRWSAWSAAPKPPSGNGVSAVTSRPALSSKKFSAPAGSPAP